MGFGCTHGPSGAPMGPMVAHQPYNLREFVENSRHPDPRRVGKGGPELRLLTLIVRDCSGSGGSGGSADEFATYDFAWSVLTKSALGGPMWSPF